MWSKWGLFTVVLTTLLLFSGITDAAPVVPSREVERRTEKKTLLHVSPTPTLEKSLKPNGAPTTAAPTMVSVLARALPLTGSVGYDDYAEYIKYAYGARPICPDLHGNSLAVSIDHQQSNPFEVQCDVDYYGYDMLKRPVQVSGGILDCMALCAGVKGCQAATFVEGSQNNLQGDCYLKSHLGWIPNPLAVSKGIISARQRPGSVARWAFRIESLDTTALQFKSDPELFAVEPTWSLFSSASRSRAASTGSIIDAATSRASVTDSLVLETETLSSTTIASVVSESASHSVPISYLTLDSTTALSTISVASSSVSMSVATSTSRKIYSSSSDTLEMSSSVLATEKVTNSAAVAIVSPSASGSLISTSYPDLNVTAVSTSVGGSTEKAVALASASFSSEDLKATRPQPTAITPTVTIYTTGTGTLVPLVHIPSTSSWYRNQTTTSLSSSLSTAKPSTGEVEVGITSSKSTLETGTTPLPLGTTDSPPKPQWVTTTIQKPHASAIGNMVCSWVPASVISGWRSSCSDITSASSVASIVAPVIGRTTTLTTFSTIYGPSPTYSPTRGRTTTLTTTVTTYTGPRSKVPESTPTLKSHNSAVSAASAIQTGLSSEQTSPVPASEGYDATVWAISTIHIGSGLSPTSTVYDAIITVTTTTDAPVLNKIPISNLENTCANGDCEITRDSSKTQAVSQTTYSVRQTSAQTSSRSVRLSIVESVKQTSKPTASTAFAPPQTFKSTTQTSAPTTPASPTIPKSAKKTPNLSCSSCPEVVTETLSLFGPLITTVLGPTVTKTLSLFGPLVTTVPGPKETLTETLSLFGPLITTIPGPTRIKTVILSETLITTVTVKVPTPSASSIESINSASEHSRSLSPTSKLTPTPPATTLEKYPLPKTTITLPAAFPTNTYHSDPWDGGWKTGPQTLEPPIPSTSTSSSSASLSLRVYMVLTVVTAVFMLCG